MKHLSYTLLISITMYLPLSAQEVTYARDIAPVIYQHCTSCHRSGEIAPFPLTNYNEVSNYGPFIRHVTSIRYMPPWKPERGIRHYQKENYLTDEQIALIGNWVDQGMKYGDPADEPELPEFPEGSQVGTPDLVVSFAQSYVHKGTGIDEYRYFVIPTHLTEDKYLTALEIRPGNKKIVHHTLVWADSTGESKALDDATPEYGYEGNSGAAASNLNNQLPGYVPGQKPIVYTDGLAIRIPKGSDLLLQMHYAPSFSDESDSTSINLFFSKEPPTRAVQSFVMVPLPQIINELFIIPANQVKTFHGKIPIPAKTTLLGLAPHSHLLGKNWDIFAVKPGNDTVRLMKINEWDFNWQGSYSFVRPVILPAGSELHAIATYDNTTSNINNPNDPPKLVSWGEKTSDEMYYLPLIYMNYQPGDENLVFDDESLSVARPEKENDGTVLYPVYPNPASDETNVYFTLHKTEKISIRIFDQSGRLVEEKYRNRLFASGQHICRINTAGYSNGFYTVTLDNGQNKLTQKFIIAK